MVIRLAYTFQDIVLDILKMFCTCRKLTAEEAARMASESELERKLREASTAVQDVELYRYLFDNRD
jgi:hypothetical protein